MSTNAPGRSWCRHCKRSIPCGRAAMRKSASPEELSVDVSSLLLSSSFLLHFFSFFSFFFFFFFLSLSFVFSFKPLPLDSCAFLPAKIPFRPFSFSPFGSLSAGLFFFLWPSSSSSPFSAGSPPNARECSNQAFNPSYIFFNPQPWDPTRCPSLPRRGFACTSRQPRPSSYL